MRKPDAKWLAVGIGLTVFVFVIAFNHDATQNLVHILQFFPPILYVPIPSGKESPPEEPPAQHQPEQCKQKPTSSEE